MGVPNYCLCKCFSDVSCLNTTQDGHSMSVHKTSRVIMCVLCVIVRKTFTATIVKSADCSVYTNVGRIPTIVRILSFLTLKRWKHLIMTFPHSHYLANPVPLPVFFLVTASPNLGQEVTSLSPNSIYSVTSVVTID